MLWTRITEEVEWNTSLDKLPNPTPQSQRTGVGIARSPSDPRSDLPCPPPSGPPPSPRARSSLRHSGPALHKPCTRPLSPHKRASQQRALSPHTGRNLVTKIKQRHCTRFQLQHRLRSDQAFAYRLRRDEVGYHGASTERIRPPRPWPEMSRGPITASCIDANRKQSAWMSARWQWRRGAADSPRHRSSTQGVRRCSCLHTQWKPESATRTDEVGCS